MDKKTFLDFIQNNIPNIRISEKAIACIAENFEEREIIKNDFLLREGKISGYFFLADGFMRAYTFDAKGNEITTYFYSGNRIVFEASSFFLRVPSTENIQAVIKCVGYYTTFEKLNGLFHSTPEFREFARAILVTEFVAFKQRTLGMINKSAEERYEDLINTNKEIFQHAQLKHIASYLGVTDTSLSRIRHEFAKR